MELAQRIEVGLATEVDGSFSPLNREQWIMIVAALRASSPAQVSDERALGLAMAISNGKVSAIQGAVDIMMYATDAIEQEKRHDKLPPEDIDALTGAADDQGKFAQLDEASPAQEPVTTEPVMSVYHKALEDCLGCITAAEIEGLHETINSLRDSEHFAVEDVFRLIDIIERRLMWVRNYAEPALASPAPPQPGRDAVIEECAKAMPTNWCDSLLTGPKASKIPVDCHGVERLLRGIQDRIRALTGEPK
jgi:hypothetical protein